MAREFNLSVVAPDRTVTDQSVTSVVAPAHDGYMGIQAGHMPMIVALKAGVLEFRDAKDQRKHVAIGGGFLEVSGESVICLADDAVMAEEIDIREAEAMLDRARKALRGEDSTLTMEDAAKEIDRAMTRIKAARRS
jgi:F-type H+-transporting ATPase subunit epsilon